MNVIVYCHVQLWPTHLAEVIEIALKHLNLGHKVTVLYCDGDLSTCPANPGHSLKLCADCLKITELCKKEFLKECSHEFLRISKVDPLNISIINSTEALRNYRYKQLPIGELVLSQLVDNVKDCYIDIDKYLGEVSDWLNNGVQTYEGVLSFLHNKKFDKMYVWNGRRVSDGVVYHAAIQYGLEAEVFISGGKRNTYMTLEAPYVHSLSENKKRIKDIIQRVESGELSGYEAEAHRFYANQRYGHEDFPGFVHFALGKNIKFSVSRRKTIAVFTSSFSEYFSLRDFQGGLYLNHYDGIVKITSDEDVLAEYDVVIRWHPNLKDSGGLEKSKVYELISKNTDSRVRHISPESMVDSYDLLTQVEVVMSFGSTIGIEAAYYNKPSILLGRQWYEDLDCIYRPRSHNELLDLLKSNILPKNNRDALIYGWYMRNYGQHQFKFIKFRGDEYIPTLNGVDLIFVNSMLPRFLVKPILEVKIRIHRLMSILVKKFKQFQS